MSKLEERIEIANPEQPHVATVLLLDTSGSMGEEGKIEQLNSGLKLFKDDVASDDLARKRVDLAVITFGGGVNIIHDFSTIEEFDPPVLQADGGTPMGQAILKAIDLIESRKSDYKAIGTDYYRPWIFMMTDGEPTDMSPGDPIWNNVQKKVHDGEANKKFLFFAVGVDPANMEILKTLSPPTRVPIKLKQGKFKEMFQWLSRSQQMVSGSRVGEQITPPSPTGWGEFSV